MKPDALALRERNIRRWAFWKRMSQRLEKFESIASVICVAFIGVVYVALIIAFATLVAPHVTDTGIFMFLVLLLLLAIWLK